MGFFKKLFKKNNWKNKYNIKANKNEPILVYGIPKPIDLKDSSDDENVLKRKCYEIMDPDLFYGDLLVQYMNSLKFTSEKKLEYLNKLVTDREIFNEFSKYLVQKKFNISNAVEINGKTAKTIFEENPELTAIEIYIKLIDEKKAKH